MIRVKVKISGIVQGVGFRPFIFRVAKKFSLKGYVSNTGQGVILEFEGENEDIYNSLKYIKTDAPKGALIENIEVEEMKPLRYEGFSIKESSDLGQNKISISPDLALCEDCVTEMDDQNSRFYKYPFISCTNCGPRFTILEDIPYDRPATSMKEFEMCSECREEYIETEDRRYHAQTISCHNCGPKLTNSPEETIESLKLGKIVAIKGVGGYHLACDAKNDEAVEKLRQRKKRPHKPFAVMMNFEKLLENCYVTESEENMLKCTEAPIVLLEQKETSDICKAVNPNIDTLGVMLPYTGLHRLLLENIDALVMTSANISSEPILADENEAKEKLGTIVDDYLSHNRKITNRCDDSVIKCFGEKNIIIRRSRGFVPKSINIDMNGPDILALGGDIKNTFCIFKDKKAYLSQHIGDLLGKNTFDWYVGNIKTFKELISADFKYVVCDHHPEYQSTRFANTLGLPIIKVQHHHAHIAAVTGEHDLDGEVIGVAFDGTGFGDDGTLWGGEFFAASRKEYKRMYNFEPVSMPGGEAAVKEPWRMGASYLYNAFRELPDIELTKDIDKNNWSLLKSVIDNNISAPKTSSAGRLFDAVSAIIGIRRTISYEGQAAIELEAVLDESIEDFYEYEVESGIIKTRTIIEGIVLDIKKGISKEAISAKFHNTMSQIVVEVCEKIKSETGLKRVALGGGVFQNVHLLKGCINKLSSNGFEVYFNTRVPTNDGGLSFGQGICVLEALK